MKLNKKYLFTTILVFTLLFFCVFFLLNHRNTRATEVSLSDFLWPKGGMLFVMYHTVAEQENDLQGIHVQSTHDDTSLHVQNGWFNMISPTKVFVHGNPVSNDPLLKSARSFFVTTDAIIPLQNKEIVEMKEPSVSPSHNSIRFTDQDGRLCIATIHNNVIENCHSIADMLPESWDFENEYYFDGDWKQDSDLYIVQIRSRNEHYEVPSEYQGNPPVRIQKEVARFEYNPQMNSLKEIPINEHITLKRDGKKRIGRVDSFASETTYSIQQNPKQNRVDVYDPRTNKRAKLFDAYYSGKMPLFDIYGFDDTE